MAIDGLTGIYSAIAFDCADTLLRMDPSRVEIFCDAATSINLTLSNADVERAYDMVDFGIKMRSSSLKSQDAKREFYRSINAALCNALGIQRSLPALHPILMAEFARRRRWRPFPDAEEALRRLETWMPLYVLANWNSELPAVLRNAGIGHFFRDVQSSEVLGSEKPDPRCFEAFLNQTSLDPSRTLYIGNEYVADVVGARAAGLTPILVDRDEKMRSADCLRISSLAHLEEILEGHLPSRSDFPAIAT